MLKKRQPHQSIIRGDESNEETLGSSRHIPKRHRTLDVIEPVLPSTSDQNSTHLTRSRQSARSQSFTRPLTRNSKHSGASLRPQSSQPQSVQPPPNYAGSQVSGNSPTETGMASPRLSSVTHRSFGDFHNNDADKDDFQETQTQDSQIPQRALRELSSNTLNRPKHRSTRKSTVRELEVSDFDVLSDKSYQDLRKILKTSYNEAMSNLDENRLPRGHNPKTLAALSGLIKRANKKLKRLLIPPNTPHQFFDTDHFKEKEANVKKALEDDITDFAQLEVATLNAERTIDLESEEYEALQDQIQKDEANRRKIQQELQTRHAFVDQQPQNDSYAWNLLRFPSSSFSKGQ